METEKQSEQKKEEIIAKWQYDPGMGPKFWIIISIILLVWGVIIGIIYLKYDEITHHPCSLCAQKIGTNIVCTAMGTQVSKEFDINGTITYSGGLSQDQITRVVYDNERDKFSDSIKQIAANLTNETGETNGSS